MLDFGWSEFFLIIVLGIVLIGPKDIPDILYHLGRMVRRLQYMKFALSKQFDDFMMQNDLQELKKGGMLGEMKGDVRAALMTPLPPSEPTLPAANEPDATQMEEEAYYAQHSAMPMSQELPLEGGHAPERSRVAGKKS